MGLPDVTIVAFGDIHGSWDEADDAFYAGHGADLFLWTGDLGSARHIGGICASLVRLPRSFGILGNHDGAHTAHVIAEALGQDLLSRAFARGHLERVAALRASLGGGHLGLSTRDLDDLGLSLVGMRPHSTGGPRHHFPLALREAYGCRDPEASHRSNIDAARHRDLIFIGHNGPLGLGAEATSPFGIDFKAGGGDLGDPDYAAALRYASASGRRVCLAIGGHMHDRLHRKSRHLGQRTLFGRLGGVPVVNACRVPRISSRSPGAAHHHTEIHLRRGAGTILVERVAWRPPGEVIARDVLYDGPLPAHPPAPALRDARAHAQGDLL